MHSDTAILSGSSSLFLSAPSSAEAARPSFYFKPGTARVDLPPTWCAMPREAQLLAVNTSDARRAQTAGQQAPMQGGPATSTSASASTSTSASTSASGSPSTSASTAETDALFGVADTLRLLCAAQPGIQPYVATVPYQLRMGRAPYVDLKGEARVPFGNISETQTVWDTTLILAGIEARALPREDGLPSLRYFDGYTLDMAATFNQVPALLSLQQLDRKTVAHFLSILDRSSTFRALVQLAADRGSLPLSGPGRWVVTLRSPQAHRDGMAFYGPLGVDRAGRSITLPLRDPRPVGNEFYLFKGGFLMPMTPMCHSVRAMVAALTGANQPDLAAWRGADGRIRPERIAALGAGERGAVDYLSQRILGELGMRIYCWISPLPFMEGVDATPPGGGTPLWRLTDAARLAFDAIGGVQAVQEYAEWQDAYLQ